jgi:hypothetical protein
MDGRVDFDAYKTSLKLFQNMIAYVQGGATRRPGNYWAAEVRDSTKATRIVRFKFSTTAAYAIEFSNQALRFYKNNGPVLEATKAITGATAANPVVVTAVAHGFVNGDHVRILAVGGMVEINNRDFKVANKTADTFELTNLGGTNINGLAFTAYTAGGTAQRIFTVTLDVPWLEADLFQLKFTQSADRLYVFHPGYAPRTVNRFSDTNWTVTKLAFLDGPYLTVNSTTTTLTPSAATGTGITVTASSIVGINNDTGFKSTDVNRLIRMKEGGVWGYVQITIFTDTTHVQADVIKTLTNINAKVNWRLGLLSDTTGFPSCGTFHEDRLMMGGNATFQQRLDGSRNGDYNNFAPTDTDGTVVDDHAVSFTLSSDDVQVLRWLKSDQQGMLVGTYEGEWIVRPSALNEALSPTNISAKQSRFYGSADIQAVRTGGAVLYVTKSTRKVRELAFSFEDNTFRAPDMTVLAEHITKGPTVATSGIKELAFQQDPISILWAVRNDGVLLGFTYERDQKVLGWGRHILGGFSDAAKTVPAKVESICVIPSSDGKRDELWMVVQRFIDGRSVRYVEFSTRMFEHGDIQADASYLDSGITGTAAPQTVWRGLGHLIGETVQVLADGGTRPDVVVDSTGKFTLVTNASKVQVGYTYNSDGQMLRLDVGAADGTALAKYQRSHRVAFLFLDTLGIKVGPTFKTSGPGKLTPLVFQTSQMDPILPTPLFTGFTDEFRWEGDYTKDNYVCWRIDQPVPCTILAVMPQLHTQDVG